MTAERVAAVLLQHADTYENAPLVKCLCGEGDWFTPTEHAAHVAAAITAALDDGLRERVEVEVVAVLDAIKAVREMAADERVEVDERGEALTDYSSGVLDGIDHAALAARKAARRPEDRREVTSVEEWWACDDAYHAGLEHGLRAILAAQPAPTVSVTRDRYCGACDFYTDHVSTAHDGLAERGLLLPAPTADQGARDE